MKKEIRENWIKYTAVGAVCGFVNGFFGAGAGLLLIPGLEKVVRLEDRKAHATCVAIILILSVFSIIIYSINGQVDFLGTLPYIIGGLAGALIGSKLLSKIKTGILSKIFGALLIYSAVRMFLQ